MMISALHEEYDDDEGDVEDSVRKIMIDFFKVISFFDNCFF